MRSFNYRRHGFRERSRIKQGRPRSPC
jgi:ribosomal protein L34